MVMKRTNVDDKKVGLVATEGNFPSSCPVSCRTEPQITFLMRMKLALIVMLMKMMMTTTLITMKIIFFSQILEDETGADFDDNDMRDDEYLNNTIPMDALCCGDLKSSFFCKNGNIV